MNRDRRANGPNDGGGRRPGVDRGWRIVQVHPTGRDEWAVDDPGYAGHERGAHGRAALFGWRWIDGADGDVVGALVDGKLCLGEAVGRAADHPTLPTGQGANRVRREIVLTEVHPISVRRNRKVGVIVDDEDRLVRSRQGPQRERQPILLSYRHRFLPELDDGGAALERRLHDARRLDLVTPISGDQVEAHARESLPSLLGS